MTRSLHGIEVLILMLNLLIAGVKKSEGGCETALFKFV